MGINKIVDFAVPADHRIKLKECEKKNKYLDLARELKKLRNMKMTFIARSRYLPFFLISFQFYSVVSWYSIIIRSGLLAEIR